MPRSNSTDARSAILAAARALLRNGHEDVSLRAVAAKAGFSPASLYEYFDGRDAILAALAGEASARLSRALEGAVAKAGDPRDALIELALAYVRFASTHREDFLLLFSRTMSRRRSTTEAVSEDSAWDVVRRAVSRVWPKAPADEFAYALWAAAHGMAMLRATHLAGFRADFERADRRTVAALVDGLGRLPETA